jgi:hypothetical protein
MVIFYHRLHKINLYTDLPCTRWRALSAQKFNCFQYDRFEKAGKKAAKKFNYL